MVSSRARPLTDSSVSIDDNEEWSDGLRMGRHPRWRWARNGQALGAPRQASSADAFEQRNLDRFSFERDHAELAAPENNGRRLSSHLPFRAKLARVAHFNRMA